MIGLCRTKTSNGEVLRKGRLFTVMTATQLWYCMLCYCAFFKGLHGGALHQRLCTQHSAAAEEGELLLSRSTSSSYLVEVVTHRKHTLPK